MTELDGITDSMDMNLSKFQEIAEDREVWCVAVYGSQRARHTLVTKQQRETQIGKLGFLCVFFFFQHRTGHEGNRHWREREDYKWDFKCVEFEVAVRQNISQGK